MLTKRDVKQTTKQPSPPISKASQQATQNRSALGDFLSARHSPAELLYLFLPTTDIVALNKTSKQIKDNIETEIILGFIKNFCTLPGLSFIKDIYHNSEQDLTKTINQLSPALTLILDDFLENIKPTHLLDNDELIRLKPLIMLVNMQDLRKRFSPDIQTKMLKLSNIFNSMFNLSFKDIARRIIDRAIGLFNELPENVARNNSYWTSLTEKICYEIESLISTGFVPDPTTLSLLGTIFLTLIKNYKGTSSDNMLLNQLTKWGAITNENRNLTNVNLLLILIFTVKTNIRDLSYEELIPMLVNAGTDINFRDNEGKTALWHARNRHDTELEIILQRYGATDETRVHLKPCADPQFFTREINKESKEYELHEMKHQDNTLPLKMDKSHPHPKFFKRKIDTESTAYQSQKIKHHDNAPLLKDDMENIGGKSDLVFSCSC